MSLGFEPFFEAIRETPLSVHEDALRRALDQHFFEIPHGREQEWDEALAALPQILSPVTRLDEAAVTVGDASQLLVERTALAKQLKAFKPWRKGPWAMFGVSIDTEWRSDLKWDRIAPHLAPLEGRSVLDIGCGNGYYMMRMLGAGARFAIGADPTLLFLYQFAAFQRFTGSLPAHILPLRSEHLPAFHCFDTVFSMGVLYHRKTPLEHLTELRHFLRPGGELVLETLIVEGEGQDVLVPQGRYAKMRNVWTIPGVHTVEHWLAEAGFENIRTVDVTVTTTEEQRATEWMTFQSLPDFLDSRDASKTVEGLPAPVRAVILASRPGT